MRLPKLGAVFVHKSTGVRLEFLGKSGYSMVRARRFYGKSHDWIRPDIHCPVGSVPMTEIQHRDFVAPVKLSLLRLVNRGRVGR
jgi:hypothetical protein